MWGLLTLLLNTRDFVCKHLSDAKPTSSTQHHTWSDDNCVQQNIQQCRLFVRTLNVQLDALPIAM